MGATARRNAKFQREPTHGWSSFVSDLCPHPRKCSELGHQIVRPRQALLGCLWVLTHLTVAASQPPPASHMHLDMWSANPCRVFTTDCVLQTSSKCTPQSCLGEANWYPPQPSEVGASDRTSLWRTRQPHQDDRDSDTCEGEAEEAPSLVGESEVYRSLGIHDHQGGASPVLYKQTFSWQKEISFAFYIQ